MIVKDFIRNNQDIFGERITPHDILTEQVVEYRPLIMIKTSYSAKALKKPMDERELLNVSFVMPTFNSKDILTYIKETDEWNAVSCQIRSSQLEGPKASYMLFYMIPFTVDDRRRRMGWKSWPVQEERT